jgi:DNA-binding HxlR family transcriptional regulator
VAEMRAGEHRSALSASRRRQLVDYDARFQRAMELVGKRWTGCIVRALLPCEVRFNTLLCGIPGISDRVLTERLQELERERLLERCVDPGPPIRVSYRLTRRGHDLWPVIAALDEWAAEEEGREQRPPGRGEAVSG